MSQTNNFESHGNNTKEGFQVSMGLGFRFGHTIQGTAHMSLKNKVIFCSLVILKGYNV